MKYHLRFTTRCLLIAALLGGYSLLAAQEIGLDSTTSTNLAQNPSLQWSIGERLGLWWTVPLDANGSVFEGAGHFGGRLDVPFNAATGGSLYGDLDILRFGFVLPKPSAELSSLSVDLGRIAFKDATGLFMDQAADGVNFGFSFSTFHLDIGAAYTGLRLKNDSGLLVSAFDRSLAGNSSRWMASSRLLAALALDIPDLAKQDLNISFIMQQDLNPPDAFVGEFSTAPASNAGIGPVNTQYSTIKLGGPIVDRLFYDVWFTYGSGSELSWLGDSNSPTGHSWQTKPVSSFLGGFNLDWFVPEFLHADFKARFIWASGDADANDVIEGNTDGFATDFIPINATQLGTVFNPRLSNLIFGQLGFSILPFEGVPLQTGLNALLFLRATTGAFSAAGIYNASQANYLGTELDLFAAWRLASDLGLKLDGGLFFAGIDPLGAFSSSAPAVQWVINLALTLNM